MCHSDHLRVFTFLFPIPKRLCGSTAAAHSLGEFLEQRERVVNRHHPESEQALSSLVLLHDQNIYKALSTVLVAVKKRQKV